MAVTRDQNRESEAILSFQKAKGRDPSTDELNQIYTSVYGMDLPDDLKNTQMANSSTPNALMQSSQPSQQNLTAQLPNAQNELNQARQGLRETSQPTYALNVLQEALRTKNQTAQSPIGTSDVFGQAGLNGYATLQQSLQARRTEMQNDYVNFQNTIGQMAGVYRDQANAAMFRYKNAIDQYNTLNQRIDAVDKEARDHAFQIQLEKLKNDAARQTELYKSQLSGGQIDLTTGLPIDTTAGATAEQVATAIKQHETGGNYNAKGKAGEIGAYQFLPSTWNIISKQYAEATGLNQSLPMTPENQDAVAKWKVEDLLNKGWTPKEIALIWNTSLGGSEQPLIKKKEGAYDSEAYANSVVNILKKTMTTTAGGQKDYNQYGLLANTDFNPAIEKDKYAKQYLDYYIKNAAYPTYYALFGRTTQKGGPTLADIAARAQELFYNATGTSLPDVNIIKDTKKLVTDNNKVLNKNEILADTINRNFNLAINSEITNNVNKNATIINRLLNPFYLAIGNPAVNQAMVSNGTISQEFANLISIRNASGTTVSDKEVANEIIKFGTSVEAQKAVVERLKAEALNIHGALVDQNSKLYQIVDPLETEKLNPNRISKLSGGDNALSVQAPDGKIYTFPDQKSLDAFKKEAGIN